MHVMALNSPTESVLDSRNSGQNSHLLLDLGNGQIGVNPKPPRVLSQADPRICGLMYELAQMLCSEYGRSPCQPQCNGCIGHRQNYEAAGPQTNGTTVLASPFAFCAASRDAAWDAIS